MPGTVCQDAYTIAERLRASVDKANASHANGPCRLPVTISIGVAELESPDEDWDALVRRGDHALYAAKQAGRNCTVVADPAPAPAS